MNAKDLDNINWTLMNGQTNERVRLLSLIAQILELTSNAMVGKILLRLVLSICRFIYK